MFEDLDLQKIHAMDLIMLGESCTILLCNNKVANSLMLEKQKDCGTHVVANTNQAHVIIEN